MGENGGIVGTGNPFILDRVSIVADISKRYGVFNGKVLVNLELQTLASNGNSIVPSRVISAA